MLNSLNAKYRLLAHEGPSELNEIVNLRVRYPLLPDEYSNLVMDGTELEFQHENGRYVRIWGPKGCIEMDTAYQLSKWIPGVIPIGDNGGGQALCFLHGIRGYGLYLVDLGNPGITQARFVAPSLCDLLVQGEGVDKLG